MSPLYEDDPVDAKVVPKEQWYAPVARQPDDTDTSKKKKPE